MPLYGCLLVILLILISIKKEEEEEEEKEEGEEEEYVPLYCLSRALFTAGSLNHILLGFQTHRGNRQGSWFKAFNN